MSAVALDCVRVQANVGGGRAAAALRVLGRWTPLEEYTTQNVYGVWRRPEPGSAGRGSAG